MDFINKLNETSVTYIRDLSVFWPDRSGPGYEATTYYGEIVVFRTWKEANEFRLPIPSWQ